MIPRLKIPGQVKRLGGKLRWRLAVILCYSTMKTIPISRKVLQSESESKGPDGPAWPAVNDEGSVLRLLLGRLRCGHQVQDELVVRADSRLWPATQLVLLHGQYVSGCLPEQHHQVHLCTIARSHPPTSQLVLLHGQCVFGRLPEQHHQVHLCTLDRPHPPTSRRWCCSYHKSLFW